MVKKYRKSKNRIILYLIFNMILICIFIVLALIFIKRVNILIPFLCIIGFAIVYSLSKNLHESHQIIYLDNDGIHIENYDYPLLNITLPYNEIKKLKYSGFKFIPINDNLRIISNINKPINIEFTFVDYLELWRNICTNCRDRNSKTIISKRLLRRVKID